VRLSALDRGPLRLMVIGATGGIGRALLEQGKARGHHMTAMVRSPEKLGDLGAGVNVIRGTPLDSETVKSALAKHDAVLSALGPLGSDAPRFSRTGRGASSRLCSRGTCGGC
jgi:putative NADH-flavin reductase